MTREEWDEVCKGQIQSLLRLGVPAGRAIRLGNDRTERLYGPRPPRDGTKPSAPWWMRLGAKLLGGNVAALLSWILRFGPLIASLVLGLAAVLEPIFPGYTGIVTGVLNFLGLAGVQPDQEMAALIANVAAGILALIGFARKMYSILKKYLASKKAIPQEN